MSGFADLSAGADAPSIREARLEDATEACGLVRASIVELYFADHQGDRGRLAVWLANKTPDNLRTWIAQSHVFVAERAGHMAGVGALTGDGDVTLLYVLPKDRFTGLSTALLLGLEERARDLGLATLRVEPSLTAKPFFVRRGYADIGSEARKPLMGKTL